MYGFSVSEQCKWRLHVPRLQDGAEKSFKWPKERGSVINVTTQTKRVWHGTTLAAFWDIVRDGFLRNHRPPIDNGTGVLHQRDEIRRNEDCRRDREVLLVDQAKCLDLVSVQITKFFDFIEAGGQGFICPMLRRSAITKLAHFPFLRSHSNGSVSAWCVLFTTRFALATGAAMMCDDPHVFRQTVLDDDDCHGWNCSERPCPGRCCKCSCGGGIRKKYILH